MRLVLVFLLTLALPSGLQAQGFAGLGGKADGFAIPERGRSLEFPADHAAHPQFRIEWWYVTANLKGEDGKDYGVQWTLFRSAAAPFGGEGWSSPQLWMGNAALTTPEKHYFAERLARGGVGQAGIVPAPFSAWIDEWQLTARSASTGDQFSALEMSASSQNFGYRLALQANGPLVMQGDHGYSVKSKDGQASYYYSQPFFTVSGVIDADGRKIDVKGKAWLDREWSSQPLSPDQTGWDWFSLHFDTGDKMMGFRLRDKSGGGFTSGTWISADGVSTPLSPGELKVTPGSTASVAGRTVPVRWRVELPARGLDISVAAINEQAWMNGRFPYWEGPVRIAGSSTGIGYLEMTGYE